MPRIDELRGLYETVQNSLRDVDPDKRAPLIREGRFLLQEIESLESEQTGATKKNPLDELMARRKAKESA